MIVYASSKQVPVYLYCGTFLYQVWNSGSPGTISSVCWSEAP